MSSKKAAASQASSKPQKRSKNEALRTALGIYLRQKNYVATEKFRKSELRLVENKHQFLLRKMMERDLSKPNTFAYSNVLCIRNNSHIVDQQFGRFCHFVESQSEPLHSELKRFYAPILCHLFLELMRAQNSKAASEFLNKYSHMIGHMERIDGTLPPYLNGVTGQSASEPPGEFVKMIKFIRDGNDTGNSQMENFMTLIEAMSVCSKLEQLLTNLDVQKFLSTKYVVETTQAVVDTVRTFFERRGHVITLHILNTWIHVHIIDNEVRAWTEEGLFFGVDDGEEDEEDNDMHDDGIPSIPANSVKKEPDDAMYAAYAAYADYATYSLEFPDLANCTQGTNTAESGNDAPSEMDSNLRLCLDTLHETKHDLLKAQADYPRFINLAEKSRGLTSADMDKDECHLVAGFNNSVVQLWQMNEQTFSGKNLYHRPSNRACPWDLNNCGKEDEDEIDRDIRLHMRTRTDQHEERFYNDKYEDNSYNEYGGIELRGHGLGVTAVRFSAYFPLIYSVSKDTTMRCWRSENYGCAAIYRGHRYPIWCFDESPVRTFVATGSKDLTARLWSLEREFPFITYAGHTQDVECVAFHPNGNYLATGSPDLSVRMWDVTSGKLLRVFTDCKQAVCTVAFSPDGRKLAAGGEEKKVRIFDIAAGSQLGELKDNSACVTDLAWSSNNNVLTTACRDGTCRLYDVSRLTPMHKTPSVTVNPASPFIAPTSAPSSVPTLLMCMTSNCQRLVRVFNNRHERLCFIGGSS